MRVRFAPSPTGALHIGGARTALFNWLTARHSGGTLVLRIEDTDRERSTPENVEQILDALTWLGLDWDEGPISQVARSDRHQEVLARLLDEGHAYHSSATAEDVKAYKERHGADRGFRGEAEDAGAVRLRVPDEGHTVVHDLIRGDTTFQHVHLDDPVIARADGSVLYNFAVAVDDLDAGITDVIRGEDHLSNTPKQLLVFEALGAQPPTYAHLPLLHGPDGKKLSKRHGAASVQELRAAGYLPEAVRNYLALLGWGDTDDETILSTAGAHRALQHRARVAQPGALRRAEAALDERPLRPRAGHGGADAPSRGVFRATKASAPPSRSPRRRCRRSPTSGRWPGSSSTGPADDPAARERWLGEDGRAALGDARTALEGLDAFTVAEIEPALRGVVESRGAKPQATSSSRCAWRWPGPPSRRASSRRSRSSGATSRCAGSTRRSRRDKLPRDRPGRAALNQTSIGADNRADPQPSLPARPDPS